MAVACLLAGTMVLHAAALSPRAAHAQAPAASRDPARDSTSPLRMSAADPDRPAAPGSERPWLRTADAPKPEGPASPGESVLPPTVASLWESYGDWMLGGAAFMIMQTLLIAALVDQARRSKRAEQGLRESEERLRLLVENAGDAIYLTDMKGRIVDVNPEAERQTGFTRQELLDMSVLDLDVGQSPESLAAFAKLISTQHRASFETRHRRKDGSSFAADQRVVFLESEGRALLLSIARDITARKQAENLLTEANKILTVILDSVPADVNVVDAETLEVLFVNKAMKETYGRDCTGEICHRAFRGKEAPCDMCTIPALFGSRDGSGDVTAEVAVWEDWNPHTAKWCMNHDRALRWIDGRMARIQIATDISERKRSEQAMADSLNEKEILLREIHHRVKNNLQIISSLLNLQEQGLDHPDALAALAESRGRVMSMAMIHEQLYRSRDFSEIDVDGYLRQFLPRLVSTYKDERNIGLTLEISPITLTLDQAIPFGLIVNELVTNALKHGFRDLGNGTLSVTAACQARRVRIEVADDGRGLPAGFDPACAETLGLQLVSSLAGQLKGELTAGNGSGAFFRLEFPLAGPRDFRARPQDG
jgi:PAS domain S-box-containing protein